MLVVIIPVIAADCTPFFLFSPGIRISRHASYPSFHAAHTFMQSFSKTPSPRMFQAGMPCDPRLFHQKNSALERSGTHFSPHDNLNLPSAFWYSFRLLTTSSASFASTMMFSLLSEMKPEPTAWRTHCINPSQ